MEDCDTNEFDNSSTFDIYERVEFNNGLLISSRNVAETFYHHIEPSIAVNFHLNPIEEQDLIKPKTEKARKGLNRNSFFSKFKALTTYAFTWIKFSMRPWMESSLFCRTTDSVANIVRLLSASGFYLGEASKAVCLRSYLSSDTTLVKKLIK